MEVLIADAISTWVIGIQDKLIAPEKRPLVNMLKEQAQEMLSTALLKPESDREPQPAPGPQVEPPTQTIRQEANPAPDSLWDRLFEVLYEMRQKEEARDEQFTT